MIYKDCPQRFNMGLAEASEVLDTLREYGALSWRTMHTYVKEALYGGSEVVEGSPAYESLLLNMYRELLDHRDGGDHPADRTVNPEAAGYLSDILSEVAGERSRFRQWNRGEVSRGVVQEVRWLLGPDGMEYLGIRGAWRLEPDRWLMTARQEDESQARAQIEAAMIRDMTEGAVDLLTDSPMLRAGLYIEYPNRDLTGFPVLDSSSSSPGLYRERSEMGFRA